MDIAMKHSSHIPVFSSIFSIFTFLPLFSLLYFWRVLMEGGALWIPWLCPLCHQTHATHTDTHTHTHTTTQPHAHTHTHTHTHTHAHTETHTTYITVSERICCGLLGPLVYYFCKV